MSSFGRGGHRFGSERGRARGAIALVAGIAVFGIALSLLAVRARTSDLAVDARSGARLFALSALAVVALLLAVAPLFTVISFQERRRRRALFAGGQPIWRRLARELFPGSTAIGGVVAGFVALAFVLRAALGGFSFYQLASVATLLYGFGFVALLLGLFAALVTSDELSAALGVYAVLAAATAGPVLAGPWMDAAGNARLVPSAIDALVLASPVIVVGSAAGLDVLRTDTLYRWTPMGQRRFHYPDWTTGIGACAAAAALLSTGSLLKWSRLS